MKKKSILFVFGTRPEAIKLFPVIKELQKSPKFSVKVCITSQHTTLLRQMLNVFEIRPDYDLKIMKKNQDLFDITQRILGRLKNVLKEEKFDLVIVHGDTTTTFTGALSAFYQKIPVAHVEAGLRSGDIYLPFPEEINRSLVSRIARYNFCPTKESKNNLIKENIPSKFCYITGNTVIDALFKTLEIIKKQKVKIKIDSLVSKLKGKRIILMTFHRREHFGEKMRNIFRAIKEIAKENPYVEIVYPVHPNPNVKLLAKELEEGLNNIHLISPLDYFNFIYLMSYSYLVFTDSGGLQEEAPALNIPVILARDTTERPEAIKAGTVKLVGTEYKNIKEGIYKLLEDNHLYKKMQKAKNPYGDGKASIRIRKILEQEIG